MRGQGEETLAALLGGSDGCARVRNHGGLLISRRSLRMTLIPRLWRISTLGRRDTRKHEHSPRVTHAFATGVGDGGSQDPTVPPTAGQGGTTGAVEMMETLLRWR
jgi:hypothetical protein